MTDTRYTRDHEPCEVEDDHEGTVGKEQCWR